MRSRRYIVWTRLGVLVLIISTSAGPLLSQNPAGPDALDDLDQAIESPLEEPLQDPGALDPEGLDVIEPHEDGDHGELDELFEDYDFEDYDYEPVDDEHPVNPAEVAFVSDPPPPRDVVDEAEWREIVGDAAYAREEVEPRPELDPKLGTDFGEGLLAGVRTLAWVLVVLLLVGGLLYLYLRAGRDTSVRSPGRSYGLTDELLAASEAELETALDRNLREGAYREAIRYRFGQLLQHLRSAGLLRWVPGKTNADYRDELPGGEAGLREPFAALARQFAFATYAGREVGESQYEDFATAASRFDELLAEHVSAARGTRRPTGRAGTLVLLVASTAAAGCSEWAETYDPDEDGAYGTEMLPAILRAGFPDAEYVELERAWASEGLLDGREDGSVYVAIGSGLSYADAEAAALLGFAEAGGEVFLATQAVSNAVLEPFAPSWCLVERDLFDRVLLDSLSAVTTARGERLRVPVITRREGEAKWAYYVGRDGDCLAEAADLLALVGDSSSVRPLMTRLPHGEGGLTLLSFPLALTNVYASDSAGRVLIEEVLGYLPPAAPVVYFDAARRSSAWLVDRENNPPPEGGTPSSADDNILKHVLNRPPLAAAWYALLLGGVAFLAVGAKRRQRVIPLVRPRRNTTHEHLGNVSRLYLASPDNARMARKQLALFETWCRTRFGLAPLRDETDLERLRAMKGVDGDLVDAIERYHNTVARGQGISNSGLVRLVRILQAIRRGAR